MCGAVCLPVAGLVGDSPDGCTDTDEVDNSVLVVATSLADVATWPVDVASSQPLDCTTAATLVPAIPRLALGGKVTLTAGSDAEMELVMTSSGAELDVKGSTRLDVSKLCL